VVIDRSDRSIQWGAAAAASLNKKFSPPPLPGKEFTFTFGVNIYPFSKGK
jgi:hypothetical protein